MKLAAPLIIITLFCILSIKAKPNNRLIPCQMQGRPIGSINVHIKKAHECGKQRTKCCQPTVIANDKFEKETILLLSKIVKNLEGISNSLKQPLMIQIGKENSIKDKKISNDAPNLNEGFPTQELSITTEGNAEKVDKETDNFKEFKYDNNAVEDELEDNVRPISFIAKVTRTEENTPKVEHGSKFY